MESRLEKELLKRNFISEAEFRNMNKSVEVSINEIISRKKGINKKAILELLEKEFSIYTINIDEEKIDYKAAARIPKEIAVKYCVFAFKIELETLFIASPEPFDNNALEDLRFASGMEIRFFFCEKNRIDSVISNFYERQTAENDIASIKNYSNEHTNENSKEILNAPLVKIVDYIINQGVSLRASDIHIEPFEKYTRIRLRIDGRLTELIRLPENVNKMIAIRIKILSRLETSEKKIPQDGKFQQVIRKQCYDFRVSVIPAIYGETIVIRILYKSAVEMNFNALGFSKENIEILEKILTHSSGMILITGPTGSGKSTTLYSMLNKLNRNDKKIVTLEDPVEYNLQGVNQININSKFGLDFASGLRSVLRQDPDIIMLGEIRDEETAEIAVKASITGHLVLSTLHTKDSPTSISRLRDMGVPYYLISDSIIAVIAQRLVRKNCTLCKALHEPEEIEIKILKSRMKLYKGKGCLNCKGTGHYGRIAIYEIMYIKEGHRKIINTQSSAEELKEYCISSGMKNLEQEALRLLEEGIIPVEEYLKIALG